MIGNCITFTVWRLWTKGGYAIIHRSRHGWWPHVIWSPDMRRFEQFHPTKHRRWHIIALRLHLPPLFYRGRAYDWKPEEGNVNQRRTE